MLSAVRLNLDRDLSVLLVRPCQLVTYDGVLSDIFQALRREPSPLLQQLVAEALAELLAGCVTRQPCPNDKAGPCTSRVVAHV